MKRGSATVAVILIVLMTAVVILGFKYIEAPKMAGAASGTVTGNSIAPLITGAVTATTGGSCTGTAINKCSDFTDRTSCLNMGCSWGGPINQPATCDGTITCSHFTSFGFSVCNAVRNCQWTYENCNNNVDDDSDSKIDCMDTDCAATTDCCYATGVAKKDLIDIGSITRYAGICAKVCGASSVCLGYSPHTHSPSSCSADNTGIADACDANCQPHDVDVYCTNIYNTCTSDPACINPGYYIEHPIVAGGCSSSNTGKICSATTCKETTTGVPAETCDGKDNDCDGAVDESTCLDRCGPSSINCIATKGQNVDGVRCVSGACVVSSCTENYYDNDKSFGNGCEMAQKGICSGTAANCAGRSFAACSDITGCIWDGSAQACTSTCSNSNNNKLVCQNIGCTWRDAVLEVCFNGLDDDSDTYTDCADPDCTNVAIQAIANGQIKCNNGNYYYMCNSNYDNCDSDVTTGCEKILQDVNNCGACNKVCTKQAHVSTVTCGSGVCVQGACDAGWSDADNNKDSNGCEHALPCINGQTQVCGPPEAGTGICVSGIQTCANNAWGVCSGAVYPDKNEAGKCSDNLDNDCDGTKDCQDTDCSSDAVCDTCTKITYYKDADLDGYGNLTNTVQKCAAPSGYVTNSNDCNDYNSAIRPGAAETCDGIDNNCNGVPDEGAKLTFYKDFDADTYGNLTNTVQACTAPQGYVANTNDCDDYDLATNPSKTEICDGKDNNCNGETDEGCPCVAGEKRSCGTDAGECIKGIQTCVSGIWSATCTGEKGPATETCNNKDDDCDNIIDNNVTETQSCGKGVCTGGTQTKTCAKGSFGAWSACSTDELNTTEACNGLDDDCDGVKDEGLTQKTFYKDSDGDGYGISSDKVQACVAPSGYVSNSGDCNDANSAIRPGATEICIDLVDNNCNNLTDSSSEGCGSQANSTLQKQIISNPVLGNGKCEAGETQTNAPVDCGCPTGKELVGSQCKDISQVSEEETTQECGNDAVEGTEQCDTGEGNDADCPGACNSDCTCAFLVDNGECSKAMGETSENSPEDCAAKFSGLMLILSVVVLLVGVCTGYWYFKIKPGATISSIADMEGLSSPTAMAAGNAPESIESYINQTLSMGFPADKIRAALVNRGWDVDAVDGKLKSAGADQSRLQTAADTHGVGEPGENTSKIEEYVTYCMKQGYDATQIKTALLSSGWNEETVEEVFAGHKDMQADIEKIAKGSGIKNPSPEKEGNIGEFARKGMKKGHTIKQIRHKLEKEGWDNSAINKHMPSG